IDLPRPAASYYPPVEAFKDNIPKLAQSGFGANDVASTPLNLALAAAAVANNGTIMTPYTVAETRDRNGKLLSRATPRPWKTNVMKPETLAFLKEGMVQVVQSGTARCCLKLASGAQAAAKTGTAQLNTPPAPPASHAWITTYAPAEAPR